MMDQRGKFTQKCQGCGAHDNLAPHGNGCTRQQTHPDSRFSDRFEGMVPNCGGSHRELMLNATPLSLLAFESVATENRLSPKMYAWLRITHAHKTQKNRFSNFEKNLNVDLINFV